MRTKLTCKECSAEFTSKTGHLKQKTCSFLCGYKYRAKHHKSTKGTKRPNTWKARQANCIKCGNSFRAIKDFKTRKQKYCSKACWSIRGKTTKTCLYCKSTFTTTLSTKKQYCNSPCRNKHYKQRFIAEKSHLWKGGKTKQNKLLRTRAEYREWRLKVFQKNNFHCVLCGVNNDTLEADHIQPVSEYPELVYVVQNGRTLCKQCHQQTPNYGFKQYVKLYGMPKVQCFQNLTGKQAIRASDNKAYNELKQKSLKQVKQNEAIHA